MITSVGYRLGAERPIYLRICISFSYRFRVTQTVFVPTDFPPPIGLDRTRYPPGGAGEPVSGGAMSHRLTGGIDQRLRKEVVRTSCWFACVRDNFWHR